MSAKTSESIELQIVDQVSEDGDSMREAARSHGVSETNVRNIIKRYSVVPADYITKLARATGVAAMRFSLIGFEQLTQRLTKGEGIQAAQLAVMAGIGASRGNELLSKPQEVTPPDWHAIRTPDLGSPEGIQTVIEHKIISAE